MKFIAHRERDLEHLSHLKVVDEDLKFVAAYLDGLSANFPNESGRIEMARRYVDAWKGNP